nr:MAG TPA: hypothetical protein [Caudoviricetes sp.]
MITRLVSVVEFEERRTEVSTTAPVLAASERFSSRSLTSTESARSQILSSYPKCKRLVI